jgi:hypothetical protein
MTPTSTSPATLPPSARPQHRPGSSRANDASMRRRQTRSPRRRSARDLTLDRYNDPHGQPREVIARPGAAGSTLVIDRDRASGGDQRLVAHLGGDEPATNAALVCSRYLQDTAEGRGHCRALDAEDGRIAPFEYSQELERTPPRASAADLIDRLGSAFALEQVRRALSIPELRWCRSGQTISVREAIASLESYEPVRALTLHALALHSRNDAISTTVLRAELTRIQDSPIVLNRRLREVVLATVERQQLSMSEIAIRCGRVKHDRKGNQSGETSWLARRVGLLPEGGRSVPTPWIHSDVLALIARHGLGVSPREVELC